MHKGRERGGGLDFGSQDPRFTGRMEKRNIHFLTVRTKETSLFLLRLFSLMEYLSLIRLLFLPTPLFTFIYVSIHKTSLPDEQEVLFGLARYKSLVQCALVKKGKKEVVVFYFADVFSLI